MSYSTPINNNEKISKKPNACRNVLLKCVDKELKEKGAVDIFPKKERKNSNIEYQIEFKEYFSSANSENKRMFHHQSSQSSMCETEAPTCATLNHEKNIKSLLSSAKNVKKKESFQYLLDYADSLKLKKIQRRKRRKTVAYTSNQLEEIFSDFTRSSKKKKTVTLKLKFGAI